MTTELSLPQRAAVALNSPKYEKELLELIEQSKDLTEVKDAAGRDQIHRAAMTLTNTRVSITKSGKAAREDAMAFSSAVIAEEKRLVSLIKPHEDRLFAVRDVWDEKIEKEKQAKLEAEKLRVSNIRSSIDLIRNSPSRLIGYSVDQIKTAINGIRDHYDQEFFYEEFFVEAKTVFDSSIQQLKSMIKAIEEAEAKRIQEQQEREAEVARLKSEREENERVRAELAAQQKLIDDQAKAARLAREAEQAIENEKLRQERLAMEKEQYETKLAAKRLAEQQAEFEQRKQDELRAKESALQAEADRIRFETEQAYFIEAMQAAIPQISSEKIADKMIKEAVETRTEPLSMTLEREEFIKTGEWIEKSRNFIPLTKQIIIDFVVSKYNCNEELAEAAIVKLFTTKD
jgi:hypothetical protein